MTTRESALIIHRGERKRSVRNRKQVLFWSTSILDDRQWQTKIELIGWKREETQRRMKIDVESVWSKHRSSPFHSVVDSQVQTWSNCTRRVLENFTTTDDSGTVRTRMSDVLARCDAEWNDTTWDTTKHNEDREELGWVKLTQSLSIINTSARRMNPNPGLKSKTNSTHEMLSWDRYVHNRHVWRSVDDSRDRSREQNCGPLVRHGFESMLDLWPPPWLEDRSFDYLKTHLSYSGTTSIYDKTYKQEHSPS